MAEQTTFSIKGGVELDTTQATKAANKLKGVIDDAVKPRPGAAARATAEKASGQGETKTARSVGAGAGTGSAASDFAAQASGLGGLVHVYATFAANIFAVSAAFNALSKAMDVTNLVKGLDQLGISSGRNLGAVAKQMVAVADGAISLQQAMTSTAMASSAGMTNQAILRMTEVAKKASIALGRDMTDSMDRLTKGIVKTQPELLDELGIMARVIPAQQEYARQLGKSTTSLTEFEKRQAFANAVLSEGERKFGAIALDANPYSKIIASTHNLLQAGLELVNKFLTPLLSLLSSSPTALAVALGGIATMLLKQAIPAIGMFRENARRMAEEATVLANKRTADVRAAALGNTASVLAQAKVAAQEEQRILSENLAKLQATRDASTMKAGSKSAIILAKAPQDVSEKELQFLDKQAARLAKTNALAAEGYSRAVENITLSQNAYRDHKEAEEKYSAALQKNSGFLNQLSIQQRIADTANQQATTRRISSIWAENTQLAGFFKATKQGWADLKAARANSIDENGNNIKGISNIQVVATGISGTAKSAVSSVMTLASSLSNVFMVVGLVTAAAGLLDAAFSKNTKTMAEFDSSISTLSDSVTFLSKVYTHLWSQDSSEWLSAQSLLARANAIDSVTTALEKSISKFKEAKLDANWYDDLVNNAASAIGLGMEKKLSKQVNRAISESIKLMPSTKAKSEFIAAISEIYKVPKGTVLDLENLPKIDLAQQEQVVALQKKYSLALSNSSAVNMAAKESFVGLNRAMQDLTLSITPTDPITKFGTALIDTGSRLRDLFSGVNKDAEKVGNAFQELVRLSNNTQDSGFLTTMSTDLIKDREELQKLNNEYNTLSKAKEAQDAEFTKVNAEANKDVGKSATLQAEAASAKRRLSEIMDQLDLTDSRMMALETRKGELVLKYAKMGVAEQNRGMELVGKKFALEIASAYLKVQGIIAGGISGVAGVSAREDVSLKEIGLRQASNNIMIELIKAQKAGTASQELLTIQLKLADKNTGSTERDNLLVDERAKKQELKVINSSNPYEAYKQGAKSEDMATSKGSEAARGTAIALQELVTKNSVLGAEAVGVKLKASLDKVTESYVEINRIKQQSIELDKISIAALTSLSSATNSTTLQSMANTLQEKVGAEELLKIENDRKSLNEKFAIEYAAATSDKLRGQLAEGNAQKSSALRDKEALQIAANSKVETEGKLALLAKLQSIQEVTATREKNALDRSLAVKQNLLENQDNLLEASKDIGTLTEVDYIAAKGILEVDKLRLANEKEIADAREVQSSSNRAADAEMYAKVAETNLNVLLTQEQKELVINEIVAKRNGIILESSAAYQGIVALSDARTASEINLSNVLTANKQHLQEQADQMTKMQSITESLTTAFGEMGNNIGKVGEALLKSAQATEDLAKRQKEMYDKGPVDEDGKDFKKLQADKTKAELDSITRVAGASKKMFGEKTAAYKLLDTMERASAIMKTALLAKEVAMEMWAATTTTGAAVGAEAVKTGATAAGETTRNALKVPGIFATFASMMGPWGLAAAAAVVAAIGLNGINAGSFEGPSTEQLQAASGTGQSYSSDNQLHANGGGALGDINAKSTALIDGIEKVFKVNYELLQFNKSETLVALEQIRDNTAMFVKGVGSTLASFGGSSAFGTVEGKATSGYQGLGGIFGGSETTNIKDVGTIVQGSLGDLISGQGGIKQTFEDVSVSWSRGFWDSGTNNYRALKDITGSVDNYITNIFTGFKQILVTSAKVLGVSEQTVSTLIDASQIKLNVSGKGLTGAEYATAIMSELGIQLDIVANKIFPNLKELKDSFQNLGESTTDFLLRLINDNEQISLAFTSIGKNIPTTTTTTKTDIIDERTGAKIGENITTFTGMLPEVALGLEKAAGGLDKFISLTDEFGDKYLTDVEKVAPKISAMHTEMGRLGISTGITKSGLKDLVLNYKITDEASAKYYVDLMSLSNAYETNSSAITDIVDKLGLSNSSIKSILRDAVNNANSAEEARALGTAGAADAIGTALQDSLMSGISGIIGEAMNSIVTNLIMGSTSSAVNLVTGGAIAGTNMASAGAITGANIAGGGTVAAANIAGGGASAGSDMSQGGANAANAMIAGGHGVNTIVAGAVAKVKTFVSTFVEVMKDPEVQASLKDLTAGFGEFAAQAYTGSSAISGLTTSIGGTAKAAKGSGGGGGAAGAANDLASAWQSAADSIFKEVSRIRELMVGTGAAALDAAQAKFDAATALARGGDLEAAKSLPELSKALLTTAESTTSTLLDLRKIQGATQSSLEQTGLGAVGTYGLKVPSYSVGTDYVPEDQLAMVHKGEQIVPAAYNTNQNSDLLAEIRALRQEVATLREVTALAGGYTKKTSDTLTRVTLGGESMQSTVIASVPVPVA